MSVSSPQAVCGNAGLDGPADGIEIEPVAVDASCVAVRKGLDTEAEASAAGARTLIHTSASNEQLPPIIAGMPFASSSFGSAGLEVLEGRVAS